MITTRIVFIITLTVNISYAYAYQMQNKTFTQESTKDTQNIQRSLSTKLFQQIVQEFKKKIEEKKQKIYLMFYTEGCL